MGGLDIAKFGQNPAGGPNANLLHGKLVEEPTLVIERLDVE